MSQKSLLEESFQNHFRLLYPTLPQPSRQFPVLNPATGRFWKIDFCWVPELLSVEIVGGAFMGKSGHNTATGQAKDYIKHNHLTKLGYCTLYFNSLQLKDMVACVEEVAELLTNARPIQ